MFYDLSGYPISVANEQAQCAWNATLEAVMSHAAAAPSGLSKTLDADPDFALAEAANGLMLLSLARSELAAPANECLRRAQRARAVRGSTWREAKFIDALAHWLADAPRMAARVLEAVLADFPLDTLALKLSHTLRFMLGEQTQMLAVLRRVAPSFGPDHPLSGFVQGCFAFALEEQGFYAEAERIGRHAVDIAPRDVWGRHAVAHVLEMTGRPQEGIAWLRDSHRWAHANNFRFHIAWHLALFHLERGDTVEVLRLYDSDIRGEQTDDYRDIANAASLLLRLEFAGVEIGARWDELAERAERRIGDGRLVFADLHYAVSLLGAGRTEGAEAIARTLIEDGLAHRSPERRDAARAGASAAYGLIAFSKANYAEAVRLLSSVRERLGDIGGSHAQRDLFEQAYIESLMRLGSHDRAADLLRDRITKRGGSNLFAARRMAEMKQRRSDRLAALIVASTSPPVSH